MGTSTNHPSPDAGGWRLARAVLGRTNVPVEQQSVELWRAVAGDRGERLLRDFGNPLLAAAVAVAVEARTPIEALGRFDDAVRRERAAGLTLDMGRRALARTVAAGDGAAGFGAELFAEAAGYYVSRDLPSYLGAVGRVATATEAVILKDGFRAVARQVARGVAGGESHPADPQAWRAYVARVVDDLRARRRAR